MYNAPMETIGYYENQARRNHPEIRDEWVEQVVANPHHTEIQDDGRVRHYGYIAEAGRWIRVVLDEGKLLNRFFDRGALRKWGIPETRNYE